MHPTSTENTTSLECDSSKLDGSQWINPNGAVAERTGVKTQPFQTISLIGKLGRRNGDNDPHLSSSCFADDSGVLVPTGYADYSSFSIQLPDADLAVTLQYATVGLTCRSPFPCHHSCFRSEIGINPFRYLLFSLPSSKWHRRPHHALPHSCSVIDSVNRRQLGVWLAYTGSLSLRGKRDPQCPEQMVESWSRT